MNIRTFLARNERVADTHEFARDHRSTVNSLLFRAGLPTMGKGRTMGDLRALVARYEGIAQEPTHEPAHEAITRKVQVPAPAPTKVTCYGVNLSASSKHVHCARTVTLRPGQRPTEGLCHDHEDQRGRVYDALLAERAENIRADEARKAEYRARKEARETLAEMQGWEPSIARGRVVTGS